MCIRVLMTLRKQTLKKPLKRFPWLRAIPMIAMMVVIFCFSAQSGEESSETSNIIVKPLVDVIENISNKEMSQDAQKTLSFIVRKGAHFSEYALLALTVWWAAGIFTWKFDVKKLIKPISVVAVAALYATSDELHQALVADRMCSGRDILIDSCGALCMVCLIAVLQRKSSTRINAAEPKKLESSKTGKIHKRKKR